MALLTQADEVAAATTQLGYTPPLSAAQKKAVNSLALSIAKGKNAVAATQAKEASVQGVLATRIQNSSNLVQLRGTNAAQKVQNQITNFQNQLLQMVAGAGTKVLTPAFQQQFANAQTHFAATIQADGGQWVNIPLESIAPQVQNSALAGAGIGLTNASAAAVLTADTTALNTAITAATAQTAATAAAALNPSTAGAIATTGVTPTASPVLGGAVTGTAGGGNTSLGAAGGGTTGSTTGAGTASTTSGSTSGIPTTILGVSTEYWIFGIVAVVAVIYLGRKKK